MKKLLEFLSVVIAVLLIATSGIAEDKIKMGCFNLVPHAFNDKVSKKLQGASIDYFNSAGKAMGYEIEWVGPLPFPRLMMYLKEGKIDGSVMMNRNPDREVFLLYPENPYYMVQRILVVRKDNKIDKITSINDILGYKIGFLKNAHLSPFIKDNMDKIKLDLISNENWVTSNLLKLNAGRVDAVYDLNPDTMLYEAKKLNIENNIKILNTPEPPGGVYIVFSKKSKKGKSLLDNYQQIIQDSNMDYDDFLRPYFE